MPVEPEDGETQEHPEEVRVLRTFGRFEEPSDSPRSSRERG